MQTLDDPLRLRVARLAEEPVDLQLAAEGGEPSVGRPRWECRPAWRSQTSISGMPPSVRRQRRDAGEQVLGLLREDQRAGARARVAEAGATT